ncbi:AlwI family type II restriction endonuclease [Treponema pectinovorum]|uniref:AlwI family type II restriction endonuclease n=1 Tax=Treponema pectinovorum TaxID=164 RepID=UPI0011CB85E3|nr:AlwI family type II restriction endonuclease [Treponema pectinovorum]
MASRERNAEYKPLLYTTTVRNPERIKYNLFVLKKFENKILTNDLATAIVGELIRYGLYRPMKVSVDIKNIWNQTSSGEFALKLLDNKTVSKIIDENPQRHKEAHFDWGYPSRFATIFDLAKEFGFVYFKIGQKIEFSELGNILVDIVDVHVGENNEISLDLKNPGREQLIFLQSLARSQRANPFVKVLNDNIPLLLLLQTIRLINSDFSCGNNCGISRKEIPLLLFWKNNNAAGLYSRIKQLRKDYGYNPSDEIVIDICIKEIMQGQYKKFDPRSIMNDYVDEFIRKMRMTGLISIRGAGRFIDINHNEDNKVEYILNNYSDYERFNDEHKYFVYMSKIDERLIAQKTEVVTDAKTNDLLSEWLKTYDWNKIKDELHILATRKISKDDVLKFLAAPVRLEFLTALAIKSKLPAVIVKPNYPYDDTGLPTSNAGGNKGDIECFEDENGILIEVTMAEGRNQTIMEVWPIERHLATFIEENKIASQCIFIAPTIYSDSKRQIKFVKFSDNLTIRDYSIDDWTGYLEKEKSLYRKDDAS